MPFSSRLLSVLQLTRMALVFTAIADGACSILLLHAIHPEQLSRPAVWHIFLMAIISIGLYGFGMSLNDIIDRRRDSKISPNRPLPSGRIGVFTAHVICVGLMLLAIIAGLIYTLMESSQAAKLTLALIAVTAILIAFYDLAGKYLVPIGLVTLGLIRFFHACIPAPQLPLLWHPLLLLNHVAILSMVAYAWEEKRPTLATRHMLMVLGILGVVDAVAIGAVAYRRAISDDALASMGITPALWLPTVAVLAFIVLGALIRRTAPDSRAAGQKLMLFGLLWLIVYDAAFITSHVGWRQGLIVLALLPIAYFSVRLMRWWSNILSLTHAPQFKRAGTS